MGLVCQLQSINSEWESTGILLDKPLKHRPRSVVRANTGWKQEDPLEYRARSAECLSIRRYDCDRVLINKSLSIDGACQELVDSRQDWQEGMKYCKCTSNTLS